VDDEEELRRIKLFFISLFHRTGRRQTFLCSLQLILSCEASRVSSGDKLMGLSLFNSELYYYSLDSLFGKKDEELVGV
jgi:hypothetical protein